MKYILSCPLFICFFCSDIFSQENIVNSSIKNLSGLEIHPITSTRSMSDVIGASYCKGKPVFSSSDLVEIGITLDKFYEGVECTVGDFDGNGFLDFAFWGLDNEKKLPNGKPSPDYQNYYVWFFNNSDVIRKIKIETEPGFPLVYFKPRTTVGKYGEPISEYDALWTWGETDDYDDVTKGIVYIFDSKLDKFRRVSFGEK